MPKRRLVMSQSAEADLDANYIWWAKNRSASQASRWYADILRAIYSLANDADLYPRAEEGHVSRKSIQELAYGLGRHPTHRVLFLIEGETVKILRVRHVSQRALGADELQEL